MGHLRTRALPWAITFVTAIKNSLHRILQLRQAAFSTVYYHFSCIFLVYYFLFIHYGYLRAFFFLDRCQSIVDMQRDMVMKFALASLTRLGVCDRLSNVVLRVTKQPFTELFGADHDHHILHQRISKISEIVLIRQLNFKLVKYSLNFWEPRDLLWKRITVVSSIGMDIDRVLCVLC